MTSDTNDAGETLGSIWDALVSRRNDIAHGQVPAELARPEVVVEWIISYESFVRKSIGTLHHALARILGTEHLKPIGLVDAAEQLAPTTLALGEVHTDLMVDDYVLLSSADGPPRVGRVKSMRHLGGELTEALPGMVEVAVGLNCEHHRAVCLEAF
jgi:hypothetical protein